eukprot:m.92311 g.92311  ORF g.92311 m.92311 type:complete len:421 (+) comp36729_c0_seq1:163-1425(+)
MDTVEAITNQDIRSLDNLLQLQNDRVHERLDDGTPIFNVAVASQNLDLVELFLAYGADVAVACDDDGSTPLHIAASWGCIEIAELLVNNGADVKAMDVDGSTPCEVAVENGREALARWLESCTDALEIMSTSGDTSLLYYSCLDATILPDSDQEEQEESGNEDEDETTLIEVDDLEDAVIPEEVLAMDVDQLRRALIHLNCTPGPISVNTEALYRRYLARLMVGGPRKEEERNFSYALCQHLKGTKPIPDMTMEESHLSHSIEMTETGTRTYFNYILIDPRRTDLKSFKSFLEAIFYIGKGKRSRPYSHLFEAIKGKAGAKTDKIVAIWADERGVINLHVFQAALSDEAFTREACMIEAIGLQRLANIKRGHYYGLASQWSPGKRLDYGIFLLWRSFKIFEIERPAEIRRKDIFRGVALI